LAIDGYGPDCLVAGRYRIERTLGEGGRGTVFLARDALRACPVALKITNKTSAVSAARLVQEADFLSCVRHPGVVELLDAGHLGDGRAYLATEWIDGLSLRSCLELMPLSIVETLTLGVAAARVLSAVHELGVIHRDIKPENLMIPYSDSQPDFSAVKLIDFGIRATLTSNAATGPRQTEIGNLSGTVYYMAPEQLSGRSQTASTDIYSLGVVLHECIFGWPPMRERGLGTEVDVFDPVKPGMPLVFAGPFVRRRLTEEVVLPDIPAVAHDVRRLLRRSLRRNPRERQESASELLGELRDALGRFDAC
jgi:serine/threonine protein kinase